MEAIGTEDRVAPIARSPLDSARGRRKHRRTYTSMTVSTGVVVIESPTSQSR